MTPQRRQELSALELQLGHFFRDLELLERALTHRSCSEETGQPSNEALEFLGDGVLDLALCDLLYQHDPFGPEGEKARLLADLASRGTLARRADALGLPELIRVADRALRDRDTVRADAYEAVLAALYLDAGFASVLRLVQRDFRGELEAGLRAEPEPKQALQELLQARGEPVPDYVLVEAAGPGHETMFRFSCQIGGISRGVGEGRSKKVAQQEAARQALRALREEAALRG